MGQTLYFEGVFEHADDVWTVLVDPGAVMLTDHASVRMAHLFGDPVDRCNTTAEQLTGVGMPALSRPAISNAGMLQVGFEEAIADVEVTDMRLTTGRVEEHEMQLVLPNRPVVSLYDIDRMRLVALRQYPKLLQGIERRGQQANLPV